MARSQRKTVCGKGLHRLSPENVYIRPSDGFRACRTCLHFYRRKYYQQHREKELAGNKARYRERYVPQNNFTREQRLAQLAEAREQLKAHGFVPNEKIRPLVAWMVDRWGTTQAARAAGVGPDTIRRILTRGRTGCRRATARKIVRVINFQAGVADIRAGRVAA